MNLKLFIALFALLPLMAVAQRDTLRGRVMVAGENASGVYVINKNTGAEVKSAAGGLFKLPAKAGDRLVVYSDRVAVREFVTGKDWFANMPYVVEADPKGYELENVQIDRSITPEGLGLVPKGQKQYTVAERRLHTAGGDKPLWHHALGLLVGVVPVDPFINAITGQTKRLKKELAAEQTMAHMLKVRTIFTTEEIISLGIPPENVDAFLYYAADDPGLLSVIDANNMEHPKLKLITLAENYMKLQQPVLPATDNQQPATKNE